MDLLLIRHGEVERESLHWMDTSIGRPDPPLTERGRRQAQALALRLAALHPARILSSDLRRAVETADVLRAACGCARESDSALREIDMGDVPLRGWSAWPEEYAAWLRHEEDLPYPGGENGAAVWARCRPAIDRILEDGSDPAVVVVHGGVIRCIVCGLLGIPQVKRFQLGSPLMNTSVTWIRAEEAGKPVHLHMFNDYSHLSVEDARQGSGNRV
ncbi:MAG: histidine phosphatase family protein [Clostridia bacterium]|nr:histidine phosphatase family protein [Clostridia bacterium]